MNPIKTDIIEAIGAIINEAGINALSVDTLSLKMGITRDELSLYFMKDDDILKFMLLNLENEIQQLINNVVVIDYSLEKELQDLFKNLYELFNQKAYYLHVLFSTEMIEKDIAIQEILKRIKKIAKTYLSQVLEQGKETGVFNNQVATSHLVENILGQFRLFMSDQQLTNKMIRDLKIMRANWE
jgi:AcrR family transcriptional regulator